MLYTDGLVGRRDQPFDVGVSRALDFLADVSRSLSPVQLIDALMETLVTGATVSDDIAVLVIERVATFDPS